MAAEQIKTDPKIIDDFFWPYSHYDIQKHLDLWVEKISDLALSVAEKSETNERALNGDELIWINLLKWQPTLIQAMQTLLMKQGFEAADKTIPIDEKAMSFWSDYLKSEHLPDERYLQDLLKGPPKEPEWKIWLQYIRATLKGEALRHKPALLYNPQKDLTLTTLYPELKQYCHAHQKTGSYRPLSSWFKKPNLTEKEDPVLDQVLDITWKHIEEICVLETKMKTWVERQIRMSYAITDNYARKILAKKHLLPKKLIPGVSDARAILFRYLTHKAGGYVEVLDHGAGAALTKGHHAIFGYMYGSNNFITYTKDGAQLFESNISKKHRHLVETCQTSFSQDLKAIDHIDKVVTKDAKTIIFIPYSIMLDFALSFGWVSWIQAIDFNKRVVRHLQNLGYTVIMKPHPGFAYFTPERGREVFGCEYSHELFEDIIHSASFIITCDINSTTISTSIFHEKPILAFHFENAFAENVQSRIEERIETMQVSANAENQLNIEWDKLEKCLINAKSKRQQENFTHIFFGSRA